uniref:Uncharacterized protein n=2 Tax=Chaetoceros debilis TaxID=122233 RepID=A0A7S3Q002_9STRA
MIEAAIVFSIAAFVGNFGVALTGFGMAIFFLFVYNVGEFAGAMDADSCTSNRCGIKDAVFYQTISLFAALPVLLYRSRNVIREHKNKTLLVAFIPATIVGTPIGNFLQDHLPSDIVRLIVGIAITFALLNTLYRQIPQTECYKKRFLSSEKDDNDERKQGGSLGSKIDEKSNDEEEAEETNERFGDGSKSSSEKEELAEEGALEVMPLRIWGTISGFMSGFLGGLVGIRGPPLMIFFLYFAFPKNVVRANSMLILLVNVSIRVIYYIIEDASGTRDLSWFEKDLWYLYVSLAGCGVLGVPIGQYVASLVNQNQFKLIIAFMLLSNLQGDFFATKKLTISNLELICPLLLF